jgi:hypothetical protein
MNVGKVCKPGIKKLDVTKLDRIGRIILVIVKT